MDLCTNRYAHAMRMDKDYQPQISAVNLLTKTGPGMDPGHSLLQHANN